MLSALLWAGAASLSAQDEKEPPPDPERISLDTADGVSLKCTYYAGTEGKKTIPIVMLHGWGGQRGEYSALASSLQGPCAIICPDLRGHGESMLQTVPRRQDPVELNRDRFGRDDLARMVTGDMEAVYKFLLQKNNEGELNIEQLCVIGADFSCIVAINWAALDWSRRQLIGYKQGRTVKAAVLLSPTMSFKGTTITQALNQQYVRGGLSLMVLAGAQDSRVYSETRRLYSQLERVRPALPDDREERLKKQDLFLFGLETSLQGTQLLGAGALGVGEKVRGFMGLRLVNKADEYSWALRENPLD